VLNVLLQLLDDGRLTDGKGRKVDFTNSVVTFDNVTLLGLTSIKVSLDSDAVTDEAGADGSVVVVVSNDQRGKIEVECQQNSPAIKFLSRQVAMFLATKAFKSASFEDLNSGTTATGPKCWVTKVPESQYGKEAASRTFIIRIANMRYDLRGIEG